MSDIFDIFWSLFAFSLVSLLSPLFEVSSKIQTRRKRYSLQKKGNKEKTRCALLFDERDDETRARECACERERERESLRLLRARAFI